MGVGEASREYRLALEFERQVADAHGSLTEFMPALGQAREQTEQAHAQLIETIYACPR